MKNSITTLLLFLLFITGFSQNYRFEYSGRLNPSVKKEKLNEAKFVHEITPELWGHLLLPNNDRFQLDEQLDQQRMISAPQQSYNYPQQNHVYPQQYYDQVIDYVSVEISGTCNGKALTAAGKSDALTPEQKDILNTADLGTDIGIKIKFKYKKQLKSSDDKIVEGKLAVTVVPVTEAEYPGGFKQMTEYLKGNVIDKISEKAAEKIQQAIVKFTVNEDGQIVDAKISRTSTDPNIDKLVLDATNKMPKWRPAENVKGIKVKQEFSIPFGGGGC